MFLLYIIGEYGDKYHTGMELFTSLVTGSFISLITDTSLGTTKPSILSINIRQVEVQQGNLILAYIFDP